jgi:hypothetical protein
MDIPGKAIAAEGFAAFAAAGGEVADGRDCKQVLRWDESRCFSW